MRTIGLMIFFYFFMTNTFCHVITYYQIDSRYNYRIELLSEILKVTEKDFGKSFLVPYGKEIVSHKRGETLLEQKRVDIAFLAVTKERDSRFLAVKYPILSGILGYRVFLINKDKENIFKNIKNLSELKKLKAGFGDQWGDRKILEENNLKLETSSTYNNLFKMLANNRFDYFPRGINEAWIEVDDKKDLNPTMIVESTLALYYPYPVYFFVHKENTLLAKRVSEGLSRLVKSGRFKELFFKHHKDIIKKSNLKNRKIFKIENSTLPRETSSIDSSWWLIK